LSLLVVVLHLVKAAATRVVAAVVTGLVWVLRRGVLLAVEILVVVSLVGLVFVVRMVRALDGVLRILLNAKHGSSNLVVT
tara:strand:- start:10582 stop:10821 length:240 start_codon:yes stop_codon:yes gene_type:complete